MPTEPWIKGWGSTDQRGVPMDEPKPRHKSHCTCRTEVERLRSELLSLAQATVDYLGESSTAWLAGEAREILAKHKST
jgi:hypothetical protein